MQFDSEGWQNPQEDSRSKNYCNVAESQCPHYGNQYPMQTLVSSNTSENMANPSSLAISAADMARFFSSANSNIHVTNTLSLQNPSDLYRVIDNFSSPPTQQKYERHDQNSNPNLQKLYSYSNANNNSSVDMNNTLNADGTPQPLPTVATLNSRESSQQARGGQPYNFLGTLGSPNANVYSEARQSLDKPSQNYDTLYEQRLQGANQVYANNNTSSPQASNVGDRMVTVRGNPSVTDRTSYVSSFQSMNSCHRSSPKLTISQDSKQCSKAFKVQRTGDKRQGNAVPKQQSLTAGLPVQISSLKLGSSKNSFDNTIEPEPQNYLSSAEQQHYLKQQQVLLSDMSEEKKDDYKQSRYSGQQRSAGSASSPRAVDSSLPGTLLRPDSDHFSDFKAKNNNPKYEFWVGKSDVLTPIKAITTYDYNDDYAAARMLHFLQVHSPSSESIAELQKMNHSICERDRTLKKAPTRTSQDAHIQKTEQTQRKVKRRGKPGRPPKEVIESRRKIECDRPKKAQVLLPDLKDEIPPWGYLVGKNNKVARLEDRDELFIVDEEGEDCFNTGSKPKCSNQVTNAVRTRARTTIDPSFDGLFVAMAQMVPCKLNADDQNSAITSYKNHQIGFPGLACRHCGGRPGSGRYFPNSVRSLSQTTTAHNMIKHFINASNVVPDEESNLGQPPALGGKEIKNKRKIVDDENAKQRIGGRHCTNCPYSVWLWLNEFQRRLSESKQDETNKIDGIDGSQHQEQGQGQRVKYGARKIFYSRVWKRMNQEIGFLRGPVNNSALDDRDDVDAGHSDHSDKPSSESPTLPVVLQSAKNISTKASVVGGRKHAEQPKKKRKKHIPPNAANKKQKKVKVSDNGRVVK